MAKSHKAHAYVEYNKIIYFFIKKISNFILSFIRIILLLPLFRIIITSIIFEYKCYVFYKYIRVDKITKILNGYISIISFRSLAEDELKKYKIIKDNFLAISTKLSVFCDVFLFANNIKLNNEKRWCII